MCPSDKSAGFLAWIVREVKSGNPVQVEKDVMVTNFPPAALWALGETAIAFFEACATEGLPSLYDPDWDAIGRWVESHAIQLAIEPGGTLCFQES